VNDFRTLDKGPDGKIANEGRAPFSLVRRQLGVGVFQLSPALFQGENPPTVSSALLLNMAERFGKMRQLGSTSDVEITESESLLLVGVTFKPREKFIRLWHGSDGLNFAFLTYGCDAGREAEELSDCERMAGTIRFRKDS
jgi:hypothetical protein